MSGSVPIMRKKPGAAGVLIFVHHHELARFMTYIDEMNKDAPVTREVYQLYCVSPTRDATRALGMTLQLDPSLQHLEAVNRLKPNNTLRDLTAPWRLNPEFASQYYLLVGLETVSAELRHRYPHPNLTLQAGKIEEGEIPLQAATRELFEEARIRAKYVHGPPIMLMSKGMFMYSVFVTPDTPLFLNKNGTLYIGFDNEE